MLHFDDVRLDLAGLRVFRNDAALDAPPQVVEVLAYLIEHRVRIVSRQELMDRFWPRAGTGGDAALNTCIRRIRTLLDDDADRPRYIQTRPRAGYRFIGTLADDQQTSPPAPRALHRARLAISGGLIAALALAVAVWTYGAMHPPQRRIAIEPVQGMCEYVLFPNFNAGLRESLVAQISHTLPAGYRVTTDGKRADLHARVSVRQTPQQTVVVLTLVDDGGSRLLWSREFAATTDTQDYVPLQRTLARQMADGLVLALGDGA